MKIEIFQMERTQCLFENRVELNLSESGVFPLRISELLGGTDDVENFLANKLSYSESDGSQLFRERIAQFYPDCRPDNITVTNGGSEANYVTLWTLLESDGRLACMIPNYMQAWGLGRTYADGVDTFELVMQDDRWALDIDSLKRAVTPKTNVILVTNPNNPTGAVLTVAEMDAVVDIASRVGAWLVVDEIYRGAEVRGGTSPTFWGRYEKVIITSGLSKAFAMPGLRVGWVVAPQKLIEDLWIRHDYLTLTPGMLSDRLGAIAMEPQRRKSILARTRRIIRENLPLIEKWFSERNDIFTYVRPEAGAILYSKFKFPVNSVELINRLIEEKSTLLIPAEYFGLKEGIRVGFGYDVDKTLKGLAHLETLIHTMK